MRFSKDHKARTHARIVDKAGPLIRRDCVAIVSAPRLTFPDNVLQICRERLKSRFAPRAGSDPDKG